VKKNDLTNGLFAALLLASPMAGAESQYPAKHFEPEILYQDNDLISKHSQAAKERAATAQAKPEAPAAPAESTVKPQGDQDGLLAHNYPVLLVIFGLAGFVFWNMKQKPKTQETQSAPAAGSTAAAQSAGETGVARYLKTLGASVGIAGETGVARYLKGLEASAKKVAETGVARYLKGLESSPKAATGETGVARYLKNRG
jgi:hypothetical protein